MKLLSIPMTSQGHAAHMPLTKASWETDIPTQCLPTGVSPSVALRGWTSCHCSTKLDCGPAETGARLQQQHEEQVRAQTEGVARVSAALKLGEEDAAAAARLREELQKAWAALKTSQDKVDQPPVLPLPDHLTP